MPQEFERIIYKALEKDRDIRYQHAADLRVDLTRLKRDIDSSPRLDRLSTNAEVSGRSATAFRLLLRPVFWISAVLLLLVTSALIYWLNSPAGPAGSLAVLPFANAGGDPNAEYLSDGITESIISSLSQIPKLRVMARSTVFRFRGADPRQAGRDLHVGAVLTGRVLQRGDTLSIRTELVDPADGSQLWERNTIGS